MCKCIRCNTYTFYLKVLALCIAGEESSSVHGVILKDGRFEGKITTPDDTYVIERRERHFTDPQHFHSVIYRHSDVKMDTLNASLCKGQALYDKMSNESAHRERRSIHRRHARSIDPHKQMCTLYLQADHLFYQKFYNNEETVIEQLTQHVQGVNDIYKVIGGFYYPFHFVVIKIGISDKAFFKHTKVTCIGECQHKKSRLQ